MLIFALVAEGPPQTRPDLQLRFYKSIGTVKMPVTWSDDADREYEVFVKGQLEMGSFVGLMEYVEYIGKEIVYKYYEQRREVQPEL